MYDNTKLNENVSAWNKQTKNIRYPLLLHIVLGHEKNQPQHTFPQTERQKWRKSWRLPRQQQLLLVKSFPHQGAHKEVCHLKATNHKKDTANTKLKHLQSRAKVDGETKWRLKDLHHTMEVKFVVSSTSQLLDQTNNLLWETRNIRIESDRKQIYMVELLRYWLIKAM